MNRFQPRLVERNCRHFFGYLRIAFNTVDAERLKTVGPDRLCAEWIIKNGGMVSFKNRDVPTKEYNLLPPENISLHLCEVDATGSSILALGFEHFKNCKSVEKIILHECKHMEDEALAKLDYVADSLTHLQVSSCYNVNDDALATLKNLKHLKKLIIYDLPYVENMEKAKMELKQHLNKCEIISNRLVENEEENPKTGDFITKK